MILVDTSIWIDHLHRADAELSSLLERDEVAVHPLVIEELSLGSLADRESVLGLLGDLRATRVLDHGELLALVAARRLWGRGLSAVDAHLLGAALISGGLLRLWTRDRRLAAVADEVGVAHVA